MLYMRLLGHFKVPWKKHLSDLIIPRVRCAAALLLQLPVAALTMQCTSWRPSLRRPLGAAQGNPPARAPTVQVRLRCRC